MKWISVKDRLPAVDDGSGKSVKVLIHRREDGAIFLAYMKKRGEYYFWYSTVNDEYVNGNYVDNDNFLIESSSISHWGYLSNIQRPEDI